MPENEGPALDKLQRLLQGQDPEEHARRMRESREGPVASCDDVLGKDPVTGKRLTVDAVTQQQYLRVRIRRMTYGDYLLIQQEDEPTRPRSWRPETKVHLLLSCLVKPDLVGLARDSGHDFDADWVAEHVVWPVVDDLIDTIIDASQPKNYLKDIPDFRPEEEGEEAEDFTGPDGSAKPSTSRLSTISGTDARAPAASTS